MEEHEARVKVVELRNRYTADPAFKALLQKDPVAALKQAGIAESDISPEVLSGAKLNSSHPEAQADTYILCTIGLLTCCCVRTSCSCIVYGGGGGPWGGGGKV